MARNDLAAIIRVELRMHERDSLPRKAGACSLLVAMIHDDLRQLVGMLPDSEQQPVGAGVGAELQRTERHHFCRA